MMVMDGSKMSKPEYDVKAIMYSAYDTPHKLYNMRGYLTRNLFSREGEPNVSSA